MDVRICPKCKTHNFEDAFSCKDCGTTLSVKTLWETDSDENYVLTKIDKAFRNDVDAVVEKVKPGFEEVLWGSNFAQISKDPPFLFGYIIITSQRLFCVYFEADTIKQRISRRKFWARPDPFSLLLGLTVNFFPQSGQRPRRPHLEFSTNNGCMVTPPMSSLSQSEQKSRKLFEYDLRDIESAQLVRSWIGDKTFISVNLKIQQNREISIPFCIPDDAEEAQKILKNPKKYYSM